MMPHKSYNALEELRKTKMKSKSRDVLPFIKGIGLKFKTLVDEDSDEDLKSSSNSDSNKSKSRVPLKEPEPEIFVPEGHFDSLEKEARHLLNSDRSQKIDHMPIRIPKAKKKPPIDEELLMEEGTHHEVGEKLVGIDMGIYKPQNKVINNYNKIFKFKRRKDQRLTIRTHTEDIKNNLNKLTKFIDINVPAVMGESIPPPNARDVINTLISGNSKFLPDTVETEMKAQSSKYDDAFDWFIYKYLERMQLNQVDPAIEEYEYSSDEDVSSFRNINTNFQLSVVKNILIMGTAPMRTVRIFP